MFQLVLRGPMRLAARFFGGGSKDGARYREVVQRCQGLRVHQPARRREGRVRPLLVDQRRWFPYAQPGSNGGVRGAARAQGPVRCKGDQGRQRGDLSHRASCVARYSPEFVRVSTTAKTSFAVRTCSTTLPSGSAPLPLVYSFEESSFQSFIGPDSTTRPLYISLRSAGVCAAT